MSELEIAVKLAELSAEVKQISLWSDVVKVGIPTLGAIVAGFFTYRLGIKNAILNAEITKNNNDFNERIEQLKIEHDKQKEYQNRTYLIIQELAKNVTEIFDSTDKYTLSIITKISLINKKEDYSCVEKDLSRDFSNASDTFHNNRNIAKANALLLGVEEIEICFNKFASAISDIFVNCHPDTSNTLEECFNSNKKYTEAFKSLFLELSKYIKHIK